jgi:hypothetical protein
MYSCGQLPHIVRISIQPTQPMQPISRRYKPGRRTRTNNPGNWGVHRRRWRTARGDVTGWPWSANGCEALEMAQARFTVHKSSSHFDSDPCPPRTQAPRPRMQRQVNLCSANSEIPSCHRVIVPSCSSYLVLPTLLPLPVEDIPSRGGILVAERCAAAAARYVIVSVGV